MCRKFSRSIEVPAASATPELICTRSCISPCNHMLRVITERSVYRLCAGSSAKLGTGRGELLDRRMFARFVRGLQSFYVGTHVRHRFVAGIRVLASRRLVRIGTVGFRT